MSITNDLERKAMIPGRYTFYMDREQLKNNDGSESYIDIIAPIAEENHYYLDPSVYEFNNIKPGIITVKQNDIQIDTFEIPAFSLDQKKLDVHYTEDTSVNDLDYTIYNPIDLSLHESIMQNKIYKEFQDKNLIASNIDTNVEFKNGKERNIVEDIIDLSTPTSLLHTDLSTDEWRAKITSSNNYSDSYSAYEGFDGSTSSSDRWISVSYTQDDYTTTLDNETILTGNWLQIDIGQEVIVDHFKIYQQHADYGIIKEAEVLTSLTGEDGTWKSIYSIRNTASYPGSIGLITYNVDVINKIEGRYYRIVIMKSWDTTISDGYNEYVAIDDCQFYGQRFGLNDINKMIKQYIETIEAGSEYKPSLGAVLYKDGSISMLDNIDLQGTTNFDKLFSSKTHIVGLTKYQTVVSLVSVSENFNNVKDKLRHVVDIKSTEGAFAALKDDGSVIVWGDVNSGGKYNNKQEIIPVNNDDKVISIIPNSRAFVAIKSDGSVIAWEIRYMVV